MGVWKQMKNAAVFGCIFVLLCARSSYAVVLERPSTDDVIQPEYFKLAAGLLGPFAYASYRVPAFTGTIETIRGDYFCYTEETSTVTETLAVVESLASAAYLISTKNPDAVRAMSTDIERGRCYAPSKREKFPLLLTGIVFQVDRTTEYNGRWEIAILEGIATIQGVPHRVYVGKVHEVPSIVS